jgi:hypothetical protein
MKMLVFDCEMAPASAYIWDLRVQGGWISPDKLIERKRLLCVAARFIGEEEVYFFSSWHDGHEAMVRGIWGLLDEADAVVHFNGLASDEPWLNTEFVLLGMDPPSPYRSVDLYRAVKRQFRLMSNSLAYVTSLLGVREKLHSGGMQTFIDVLAGDAKAQARMQEYCTGDVLATEELYVRLRPWLPAMPPIAMIDGISKGCPSCGSASLIRQGYSYSATGAYQRYKCRDCRHWSRSATRSYTTELRAA